MYTIAEVGQAHDGSLGILHSYINAIAKTGFNAIKFQTHIAHAESSKYEKFRVNFSYVDKTRYDYWKRMELSYEHWKEIKEHCEEEGLEFLSSPFSIAAVDLLEKIGIKKYKIGSGEITNILLLDKIAKTKKPVFLSTGMSNYSELDNAIDIFIKNGNQIGILQCSSEYPVKPENWGLNIIGELKNQYKNIPIGFSDHSGNIYACMAAAALGAEIFEVHVTFHKEIFGPDTKSSILVDQIPFLIEGLSQIKTARENPVLKDDISKYKEVKEIFEKSLAVNKNLNKGHIIRITDLETKKPKNKGINANNYKVVLGRKLNKNLKAFSFLNYSDLF